jgi:hypothetical protein
MTTYASCGHKLEDAERCISVMYGSWSCDAIDGYQRCIAIGEYCPTCAVEMHEQGELLLSDEEAEAWMAGSL